MNTSTKGISVIICVYNGASRLYKTLHCIANQEQVDCISVEVIVIDNASTDNTAILVQSIWTDLGNPFPLKIFSESKPGKSNALVLGFMKAQYDYLLICDDDNRLFPDYLAKAFEIMENHSDIGVLGGQGIPDFESKPPFWFETYKHFFAVGKQLPESGEILNPYNSIYSAGAIIRKSIWDDLMKIDFKFLLTTLRDKNPISGEDTELFEMVRMMGYKLWVNNEMIFRHYLPSARVTWRYLTKFTFGIGRSNIYTHAYIYCQTNNVNPATKLKFPFWFDKYIHTGIQMKRFWKITFINIFSKMEGDKTFLLYQGYRGRLFELRKIKEGYSTLYDTILRFKLRIKELK